MTKSVTTANVQHAVAGELSLFPDQTGVRKQEARTLVHRAVAEALRKLGVGALGGPMEVLLDNGYKLTITVEKQ